MGAVAFLQNFPDPQPHQRQQVGVLVVEGAQYRIGNHSQTGNRPGPRGFRGSGQHH
jgi:hypothetical protein